MLMTYHVKKGNTLPVDFILGSQANDIFRITQLWWISGKSLATFLLVFAMMIGRYSHTVSDLGLKFTKIQKKDDGNLGTVINLNKRNLNIPYEVVGDPFNARTKRTGQLNNITEISNFMAAADGIAKGYSVALEEESFENYQDQRLNIYGVETVYSNYPSFITRINVTIPFDCENEPWTKTTQQMGFETFNDVFSLDASVPTCDFAKLRSSGIPLQDGPKIDTIEITNYAFHPVPLASRDLEEYKDVTLMIGSSLGETNTFYMPKGSRSLARDRDDWKTGRQVLGINAIKHGNIIINLGNVSYAYGGNTFPELSNNEFIPMSQYFFVAEITDSCPMHNGRSSPNEQCIAIISTGCEPFVEDVSYIPHGTAQDATLFPEFSKCDVESFEYVWGKGFTVDAYLVAAVAGVFGRNAHSAAREHVDLFRMATRAIPSALFSLASIDYMVSYREETVPEVGAFWFFFLFILPLTTSFILFVVTIVLTKSGYVLPFPKNIWELLILGREQSDDAIPTRDDNTDPFPKEDKKLRYGMVSERDSSFLVSDAKKEELTFIKDGRKIERQSDEEQIQNISQAKLTPVPFPIPPRIDNQGPFQKEYKQFGLNNFSESDGDTQQETSGLIKEVGKVEQQSDEEDIEIPPQSVVAAQVVDLPHSSTIPTLEENIHRFQRKYDKPDP